MSTATTRRDSSFKQLQKRVPADVVARARGRPFPITLPAFGAASECVVEAVIGPVIKLSLRVRDPAAAKARIGSVSLQLERIFQSIRSDAVDLTHKQAVALSGEIYRLVVDGFEMNPGEPVDWNTWKGFHWAAMEGRLPDPPTITWREIMAERISALGGVGQSNQPILIDVIENLRHDDQDRNLEVYFGLLASWVLARHALEVTPASRIKLLRQVAEAAYDAGWAMQRAASGDYTPDPKASRFPDYVPSPPAAEPAAPKAAPATKTTLNGLLADWWTERRAAGLKPSTHESYRNTVAALVAFLKHEDAARVTADDVIRFKDHRLGTINPRTGKPISAKTVKDSDLSGLKAVFAWAVANRRLTANPAKDVTLKLGKVRKVRGKGFTDAEAATILKAALAYRNPAERPQTAAAKRWVPWLAAYTGARVGELAQLRRQDLRREGPHWLITITPEAGTVKTNEARAVPLHVHLVELGFPAFVQAASPGHLFLRPAADGNVLGPLQGVKNRLSEFGRALVRDPNVAPNHGWRHRFKTKGREAGMDWRVLDAIQGHAPRTEGENYGEVSVKAMARELAKLPREGAG